MANLFEEQVRLEQLARRVAAETRARLAQWIDEDEQALREQDNRRQYGRPEHGEGE